MYVFRERTRNNVDHKVGRGDEAMVEAVEPRSPQNHHNDRKQQSHGYDDQHETEEFALQSAQTVGFTA